MTVLVIGCGSIGQRHLRNLRSVGVDVIACDPDPLRRDEVTKRYGVQVFENLETALSHQPDAVFLCTPTSTHVPLGLEIARRGHHLFIEKPLSHSCEGLDELERAVHTRKLVAMVGCNMLFLSSLVMVKRLVEEGRLGRVLSARVQVGFYLPFWHPKEDYRTSYSANRSLGGGVLLDSIHEIGIIRWVLGEVKEAFCFAGKLSTLEIDTEDTAQILLRMDTGALVQIHFDYLQKTYRRSFELIGEEGNLVWDFGTRTVELYSREADRWQVFRENINMDLNQMFVNEVEHFLKCLDGREAPRSSLASARRDLDVILAAKRSAQEGSVVRL
ncbi:MAG: gfo/Idh/MocA family oxidoreductase [Nitrospiraceae bacterium]|nr:MAG: gfo/Idh/MocA family oxidoreductase [Nitrospiraceae bacterium]